MAISTQLSDSIHILAYISIYTDTNLTSKNIAASVVTSPVVVRRLMGRLREAGILETQQGAAKPQLTREPKDITLLDIVSAIDPDYKVFELDTNTHPLCIVGGNIQTVLGRYYDELKETVEKELSGKTLQDIIDDILVEQKAKEAE